MMRKPLRPARALPVWLSVLLALAFSTAVRADDSSDDGSPRLRVERSEEALEPARPLITDAPPSDEVTESSDDSHDSHDEPAEPRSRGSRRRWTDGPRRIPTPSGSALERATRLGLGTRTTATTLLHDGARPEWRAAARGTSPRELRWPVDVGAIGRGFGYVRHERPNVRHNGIDVATPRGMVIRAAADGIVAYADNGISGYGNVVLIVHANGWITLYGHQDRITVQPGWRVRRGERVGFVGATGRADGPHLHFELRVDGQPVDPVPFFHGQPWVEGRARLLVLRQDHGGHTYGHLGEIEPDFHADAVPAPRTRARAAATPTRTTRTRTAARSARSARTTPTAEAAQPPTPRATAAATPRTPRAPTPASTASTASTARTTSTATTTTATAATSETPTLAEVTRLLTTGPTRAECRALRASPVDGLTSPIRLDVDARYVDGVLRFAAPSATNVRAAAAGRVAFVGLGLRGERNAVVLVHQNGWVTVYSGIFDATIAAGALVASGDRIGIMRDGERGLGFELFAHGQAMDARIELRGSGEVTSRTPAPATPHASSRVSPRAAAPTRGAVRVASRD